MVPSPLAFCNAVDTHDHSKELDEMGEEKEKENPRDFSFFHVLVKYFLRQLARFGSDITTAGNSGAEKEVAV